MSAEVGNTTEIRARKSVEGKPADQLLKIAHRTMMLMAIDLKIMGGNDSLVDKVMEHPRLKTYNQEFVTQAADVVVAMGVVRMLGGDKK